MRNRNWIFNQKIEFPRISPLRSHFDHFTAHASHLISFSNERIRNKFPSTIQPGDPHLSISPLYNLVFRFVSRRHSLLACCIFLPHNLLPLKLRSVVFVGAIEWRLTKQIMSSQKHRERSRCTTNTHIHSINKNAFISLSFPIVDFLLKFRFCIVRRTMAVRPKRMQIALWACAKIFVSSFFFSRSAQYAINM